MNKYRTQLEQEIKYTGGPTGIERSLIDCIDQLQKEIDQLRTQISRLQQNQQPTKAVGYHDVEKFYTEEK